MRWGSQCGMDSASTAGNRFLKYTITLVALVGGKYLLSSISSCELIRMHPSIPLIKARLKRGSVRSDVQ